VNEEGGRDGTGAMTAGVWSIVLTARRREGRNTGLQQRSNSKPNSGNKGRNLKRLTQIWQGL